MKLPKEFVERNLKKAEECRIFGYKFTELTREELIAVAVAGWEGNDNLRKENKREREFLMDIIKKK